MASWKKKFFICKLYISSLLKENLMHVILTEALFRENATKSFVVFFEITLDTNSVNLNSCMKHPDIIETNFVHLCINDTMHSFFMHNVRCTSSSALRLDWWNWWDVMCIWFHNKRNPASCSWWAALAPKGSRRKTARIDRFPFQPLFFLIQSFA